MAFSECSLNLSGVGFIFGHFIKDCNSRPVYGVRLYAEVNFGIFLTLMIMWLVNNYYGNFQLMRIVTGIRCLLISTLSFYISRNRVCRIKERVPFGNRWFINTWKEIDSSHPCLWFCWKERGWGWQISCSLLGSQQWQISCSILGSGGWRQISYSILCSRFASIGKWCLKNW